ncbi:MAG: hypothetical protein HOP03_00070 [Lysobacter sp.]|nr:hypothetical protein [Lysobacter sp.]
MNFSENLLHTLIAQAEASDIDAVYTDDNNEYIVEKFFITNHGAFNYRLAIKRLDNGLIRSWRTLQDIKNSIVGEDVVAVEIYPRESDVTDTANIYHLWVFKDGLSPNVAIIPPQK